MTNTANAYDAQSAYVLHHRAALFVMRYLDSTPAADPAACFLGIVMEVPDWLLVSWTLLAEVGVAARLRPSCALTASEKKA